MNNHIKAAAAGWLLPLALLAGTGAAQAVPPAWDRPAPAMRRVEQAVLLHITTAGPRLIAVGERGLVLRSDDAGRHWTQSPTPVSATLTKAFFITPQLGWAVGHSGVVLHSDDGGLRWTRQLDGVQAARLAADKYREDSADPALRQQAAGARQLIQDGADKPFTDVLFTDARHGYVIGAYGLMFQTDDGGRHWTPAMERLDNPQGLHLYGIARSGEALLIAGEQGLLLRSAAAGRSFAQVATPYKGSYFGIVPLSGGELYLHGLRGHLYRSQDGGLSWKQIAVPSEASLSAGLALSPTQALFANQAGQLFLSGPAATALQAVPAVAPAPYTAVARAADGAWILTSMRGVARIPSGALAAAARETSK